MNFFEHLVSGQEGKVDSLVVGGLLVLVALIALTTYIAVQDPHLFNPMGFGTGAATVIGAAAGGKTARDWRSTPPAEPLPKADNPDA